VRMSNLQSSNQARRYYLKVNLKHWWRQSNDLD
jgi:hypothetical protein